MRTGYSLILGEFIDATALEHRDCEPFQVVCPTCSEPLFKVARPDADKSVEYLSHYRKSDTYNPECELRAESTPQPEERRHNAVSRNQRLQFFLQVLKSAIAKDPLMSYAKSLDQAHKRINRSKALLRVKRLHFESTQQAQATADKDDFAKMAATYIEDITEFGPFPKTGFAVTTQIRIASDVMRMLLTEPGRPNYEALFNHATLYLVARCSNQRIDEKPADTMVLRTLSGFIMEIIDSGKDRGIQIIGQMLRTPIHPPYVEKPGNYLLKMAAEIWHEMIGTLIRLPYFELLKDSTLTAKQVPSTRPAS